MIGLRVLLAVLLLAPCAAARAAPAVRDLAFAGGTERVLLLAPDRPRGTVVLLPGGDGAIRLAADGSIGAPTNFLVRSRNHWVELGYAVLLPDVPAGSAGLLGRRMTDSYAAAVAALVAFARQSSPAPVWLVGTSQGTNAVVNAASRMRHGEIAGIVLTASLTRPGKAADLKETVFDADLAAIDVPALIVSHADDACRLSPPGDGARLQGALTGSPRRQAILVSGGEPPASGPCEARSPHGFYGIEVETIRRIAAWMGGG